MKVDTFSCYTNGYTVNITFIIVTVNITCSRYSCENLCYLRLILFFVIINNTITNYKDKIIITRECAP